MKHKLTLLFLVFSLNVFAQSNEEYWANWNKNYPEVNVSEMIEYEKYYADSIERYSADSIEKYLDIGPDYMRCDKYRFEAEYLGETRPIDESVMRSMLYVYKMVIGKSEDFRKMIDTEVLFKIGDERVWMPIQSQILEAMKEEAQKGDNLLLYCFYFNQHTHTNKLYNTFLISEFIKYH